MCVLTSFEYGLVTAGLPTWVAPVWRRNSSTGCSSLRCRGGTESGLGKRVTVAPDGHAPHSDGIRVD